MYKRSRVAVVCALVAGLVMVSPLSASAAVRTTVPVLKSNDSPAGAQISGTITWSSDRTYSAVLNLKDIQPDGKGPIVFVYSNYGRGSASEDDYEHNTGGYNSITSFNTGRTTPGGLGGGLANVTLVVCNGGSKSSPQGCSNVNNPAYTFDNPYT